MPELPEVSVGVQLAIAGGAVMLALLILTVLVRSVKELVMIFRKGGGEGGDNIKVSEVVGTIKSQAQILTGQTALLKKQAEEVSKLTSGMSGLTRQVEVLSEWHQPGRGGIPESVNFLDLSQKIQFMYDLLNMRDTDGVPLIYTRASLYEAIEKMARVLERLEMLVTRQSSSRGG